MQRLHTAHATEVYGPVMRCGQIGHFGGYFPPLSLLRGENPTTNPDLEVR